MDFEQYRELSGFLLDQLNQLRAFRDELEYEHSVLYAEMPKDLIARTARLDRDLERLRDGELKVAFVGGFSAGKSSLINAILGNYWLPESVKPTTAVPTHVRASINGNHSALVHYLSKKEVEDLEDLIHEDFARDFNRPDLRRATITEITSVIEEQIRQKATQPITGLFKRFIEQSKTRTFDESGKCVEVPMDKAMQLVRDENEAMFIKRIELRLPLDLPSDIVLVDLPGISVPNPRHRKVTYDFVEKHANAVVFVLLAERVFDKDESKIMHVYRDGERDVAKRTFWVLNHWDALADSQHRMNETIHSFKESLGNFGILGELRYYKTNALHGLLSQLYIRDAAPRDGAISHHLKDYEECLAKQYDGSHELAFRESGVKELQEQLFDFLNHDIRNQTIRVISDNMMRNFITPVTGYLNSKKAGQESKLDNELVYKQKEETSRLVKERVREKVEEIEGIIQEMQDRVIDEQKSIFKVKAEEFLNNLHSNVLEGENTDASVQYKKIIRNNHLRKFPYYFEIEMAVVDNVNNVMKNNFKLFLEEEVKAIYEELTVKLRDFFDGIMIETGYDDGIDPKGMINKSYSDLRLKVEGVIEEKATYLDKLLVYSSPKNDMEKLFKRFVAQNQIFFKLQSIAQESTIDKTRDDKDANYLQSRLASKTNGLRSLLKEHYKQIAIKYRDDIKDDAWVKFKDHLGMFKKEIVELLNAKYLHKIETVIATSVNREFESEKAKLLEQNKWLRGAIDQLEGVRQAIETKMREHSISLNAMD